MKYVENEKIWNICMDAVEELDWSKVPAINENCGESNRTTKSDEDKVVSEMKSLAMYSYTMGDEKGKISQRQLFQKEKNMEIVGSHIFIRMARSFYLREKIENRDYSKPRILCCTIHAYLGNGIYFTPTKEIIGKVLELGQELGLKKEYDILDTAYMQGISNAIHVFQSYGIEITMLYGGIDCDEKLNDAIFEILEKKVKTVGGLALFVYLFRNNIADKYVPVLDRYMLSRERKDGQTTPIQILIALSLKHLKLADTYHQRKEAQCTEIVSLAQAWYNLWDVEGESAFEYTMSIDNYPLELYNQMIVDKFCIPKQYSKRFILSSLDHIIMPFFKSAKKRYSYKDYRMVIEYLMNLQEYFCCVDVKKMKNVLNVSNYKIDLILEDISTPFGNVNSEFISLSSQCNHDKCSLIRFPMGQLVYIDYHICGWGFYNSAYEMIKKEDDIIDREQGEYVETLLKEEMSQKKFHFMCGKYSAVKAKGLNNSECDFVLQNQDTYFLELKKTSIANELDNLDDVTLLRQLAKGMIKAQKQCFAHELYLKINGSIVLDDKGKKEVLYPVSKQDRCFKLSVCYQEYSFLCSKNFCSSLLQIIILGGFKATNPTRNGDLDEINKLGSKISNLICQGKKDSMIEVRDEVFYSLFCSLQQILVALWNSNDENDFLSMIKEWIYCQDKTLDPYQQILTHIYYREHPEETNLQKQAIEMFERTGKKCIFIGM